MPNRIIKESITTSDTLDQLTADEERFFYRLLVKCDDYGRMDARPKVLRAACFPLKDKIADRTILAWLRRLASVGLVGLYEHSGRSYLNLTTWDNHQQIRAHRSKFPGPDEGTPLAGASICNQMIATDSKCPRNPIQSESNTESNTASSATASVSVYSAEFEEFWAAYPRHREKAKAFKCWRTRIGEVIQPADLIAAACNYAADCRKRGTSEDYIKLPATFLGPSRPYEDWIHPPAEASPDPEMDELRRMAERVINGDG